ncbi:hypothetical protein [Arthrobacter sp. M4]|uniref:hypothetical protein n=1 Tax=Arthrobacter sp. M4 TaxID=218160 RepID=UPI001CDD640F|nr:hypothetical protein [Arthrobacter sp. M4]MCA4135277.1 hypothetical protein [Arthrobacter sp. M4]
MATATCERLLPTWPVVHGRLCATVTLASALVHLWFATTGQHGLWMGLLMVALAGVCLPCAIHLWRRRHLASASRVTACAVAMAAVHAALLLRGGHGGGGHGSGGPAHASGPPSGSITDPTAAIEPGAAVVLLGIIALEITTAMVAATLTARLRRLNYLSPDLTKASTT